MTRAQDEIPLATPAAITTFSLWTSLETTEIMACKHRCERPPKKCDFVLHISHRSARWGGGISSQTHTSGATCRPSSFLVQPTCHWCSVSIPHVTLLWEAGWPFLTSFPAHCCLLLFSKMAQRKAIATFLPMLMGAHQRVSGRSQVRCNLSRLF